VVDLRVQQLISTDSCNSDTGDISSGVNHDTTDAILGIRFVVLQVSETFCNTNEQLLKHNTTDFHMIYFFFHELYNPFGFWFSQPGHSKPSYSVPILSNFFTITIISLHTSFRHLILGLPVCRLPTGDKTFSEQK
jgi:hypothetical protein